MHDYFEIDESSIVENMVQKFEEESNESLYAGDERRILLNTVAYFGTLLLNKVNWAINQNDPADSDFDNLLLQGERLGVNFLTAEKAKVTCRFISPAHGADVLIPAHTRVTADGLKFFQTIENGTITTSKAYVDLECIAVEPGTDYNNIPAGVITTIADMIPFVTSVTNTDTSSGGTDDEKEEHYRKRVLLKPLQLNTAGSEEAYKYIAMSADSSISDVSVNNNVDADVIITCLCENGTIPSDSIIEKVESAVAKDRQVRPLTDNVTVQKAVKVSVDVTLNYRISKADVNNVETIKANIMEAIDQYKKDISSKLGHDINPEELKKYLYVAGAASVSIAEQAFNEVPNTKVAYINSVTATYDGLL